MSRPRLLGGASRLTSESPIGLRQISPIAISTLAQISHCADTRPASPPPSAADASRPNAAATRTTPRSIFTGVDGSRLRRWSQTHTATSTGESRMTPSGSKTWNRSGGHDVIVLSRAQNVNV